MATVHICIAQVTGRSVNAASMPVPASQPIAVDTMTSSATSTVSTATTVAGLIDKTAFWSVTASGGKIWAKFGQPTPTPPVAVADDGWLILDGQTREFAVGAPGEVIAIKDA